MMAFDHVFYEVARGDSRAIQAVDQAGSPATFLFREFYCTDPGCDCRRVVLQVHWVEGKRVAATINYAFEPSRRRDEPQIFLDPLNPQTEYSSGLLALFTEMIAKDGELRAQLHRHYAMWKQVVDDPSHPDHSKVRGEVHDDPSFRPAFPRKKSRSARDGRPRAQGLVAAKAARVDSKLHRRFRRLLDKVEHLRQRVRAWKEQRSNIDRELAAYAALFEQQCRLGREMVALLDRSYTNRKLTKTERKKLAAVICSIAGELLEQDGHDDLKSIYNRHSRSDFDAEVAAADAASVETVKAMMEIFGVDFGDADVDSIEKLHAYTEAQMAESTAREGRVKRKKSVKQLASEERRADEHRNAHKAVQEVYRALAMALHPDREQDPEERTRKTELMREVNIAYEAKDLLRLLELQLQHEHVDATRAESLAEERVQHYNRILDEQSKQLAMEIEELELPFRPLSSSASLAPADIVARIRVDSEAVEERIASLACDLKAFEDVSQLKAWLKTQGRSRGRSNELDLESDMFG